MYSILCIIKFFAHHTLSDFCGTVLFEIHNHKYSHQFSAISQFVAKTTKHFRPLRLLNKYCVYSY